MTRFSFFLRLPVLLLLAHIYVAVRLLAAVPGPSLWWLGLAALILLYVLILIGFTLRGRGGERVGDAAAWIGFLALGGFSWLFVLTVLRDVVLWIVAGLSLFVPAVAAVAGRVGVMTAAAVPVFVLAAVLLGLFNARRRPRVQMVDLPIRGLPEPFQGFTIVQISDLHVGPTIKHAYVQAVVSMANHLKPDLIALTGDLVDGDVERLGHHVRPLAGLDAREGVYFVTGNHEYYCGAQQWIVEFRRLGFHVLLNEHRVVHRGKASLVIAGVTDFGAAKFDIEQASSPSAAVQGAPSDASVRILLAHQPRSADAALRAGFDLQLSGHTHGGQFWPWQYFVPLQQPFVAGLHRMGRLRVYVSRGTGYWGPPMRLGARSEITCLRLVDGL